MNRCFKKPTHFPEIKLHSKIYKRLKKSSTALLTTIIGERYVPGVGRVTADDCLKREIIQQLCIKPLSHSELNKTLPDDVRHETGMERVINEVAVFRKPQVLSTGKGVYELKPEFFSEYNVFFYHYTKEELSKSEEAQRKRRKTAGELECCPPPRLPRLTEMMSLVANLLQCDVMLSVMQIVLTRTLDLKARSFSEPQVHKILHLIGYALQEQESGYYPFLAFTERATKWDIYKLLENLQNSPRIDAHKDLLTWVLDKYRQIAGASIEDEEPPATPAAVPSPPASEVEDTEKAEKGEIDDILRHTNSSDEQTHRSMLSPCGGPGRKSAIFPTWAFPIP